MKDWVDSNGGRQPQAISGGADLANDRIGTESTNIQLRRGSGCSDVAPQQPYLLTHDEEWSRPAFPIDRNLHGFAGFEEFPLQNILGLLKLRDIGIGSKGARGWGWGKHGHAWMETVVSKEWGDCCGRMARVVVRKFCQREEAGPVGLLVVNIDSQALL